MGNEAKGNSKFRARLNAREYEKEAGVHYIDHNKAAPVTNDTTIRIMLTMMIIYKWTTHIVDVQGAFLNGQFAQNE